MTFNYDLFRKVVAPEFAEMTDSDIDLFANEAKIEIAESVWRARYPRAWCLLTAHIIKLSKKTAADGGDETTGSVNELRRVKVGDLEREYAVPQKQTSGDDTLGLTLYGKEFLRLRKQVLITPLFVS